MNKKNKYLTFDDLCKIVFTNGSVYSDGGRFLGNSFGQAIRNFRNENWSIDQNTLTEQEKRVVNDIILAKQDNAPVADTFLKQIDVLTGVAGSLTNSFTCAITKSDVESVLDYINKYSHDSSAVSCVLDYLRKFCASCDITCCLWAKQDIAQMAIKWDCAQYADYSIMASQQHTSNQHKEFIKPLLDIARKDIKKLIANPAYKTKYDAIQICDDVIYRFASMSIPMGLIRVICSEFNFLRDALHENKPVDITNEFSANTDKIVSIFLRDGFLDSNMVDEFYLFKHKNSIKEPILNKEGSEQVIKNAIIMTHAPDAEQIIFPGNIVDMTPVTENATEQPVQDKTDVHVTEQNTTKTEDETKKTVESTVTEKATEQPVQDKTDVQTTEQDSTKTENVIQEPVKSTVTEKATEQPVQDKADVQVTEQNTTKTEDETHEPVVKTTPVDTSILKASANKPAGSARKKSKRATVADDTMTNIGLYVEAQPAKPLQTKQVTEKEKTTVADPESKKAPVVHTATVTTKTETAIDNDPGSTVGFYSEAKPSGFLKSLFGRRR